VSQDHIGIPKFIERGFAINETADVFDIVRWKEYGINIDRLGTEGNYYEQDVEKGLANGIESEFDKLYKVLCGTTDFDLIIKSVKDNRELITRFFSYMFSRSKKTLEKINDESITSRIFGSINHSEFLRIQSHINVNPLKIIGDEYEFYPLINFSKIHFINNSVGFGFLVTKEKRYSVVIPLNTRVAILISNSDAVKGKELLFIKPDSIKEADTINKCMCKLEMELGNGFIFAESSEILAPYIEYIESLRNL